MITCMLLLILLVVIPDKFSVSWGMCPQWVCIHWSDVVVAVATSVCGWYALWFPVLKPVYTCTCSHTVYLLWVLVHVLMYVHVPGCAIKQTLHDNNNYYYRRSGCTMYTCTSVMYTVVHTIMMNFLRGDQGLPLLCTCISILVDFA